MRILLVFVLLPLWGLSQVPYAFQISRRADMPMKTANNAVTGALVNGNAFAYSFCGIDTSLTNAGIHLRSFKYDVVNDQWALLPDVPDTLGKIAASASTVGHVIYVIGGYHVFNGSPFELSSNKVHRFDTQTDSWLSDGADIPVAIDDQVQAVWRDSLIYVVTGWSNTTNVPAVQIYNPAVDTWLSGTAVPNNNDYKAFGASGEIIGDTIYYYGGASTGFNFPAQSELRKGVINSNDPTQITWTENDATPGTIYRPGAFAFAGAMHWVGGSRTSYNYNAVAYNGSGVVSPTMQIDSYTPSVNTWGSIDLSAKADSVPVMDIRGIAFSGGGNTTNGGMYLLGGIGFNQEVLNSNYQIQGVVTGVEENLQTNEKISVFPNPTKGWVTIRPLDGVHYSEYQLFDGYGARLQAGVYTGAELVLDTSDLPNGPYFLKLLGTSHVTACRFWSVK